MWLGSSASAAESELEVIRAVLDGPVGLAERAVAEAEARAAAVSPARSHPALEVRHEEARGPAGATTDVVGGSASIDLGLSGLADRQAARLRGESGEQWRAVVVLDAICAARRDLVELWAANGRAAAVSESQKRLQQLVTSLVELAIAGEASGYERDRGVLFVGAHEVEFITAQEEVTQHRAHLSSLANRPVEEVSLTLLEPLPTLEDAQRALSGHPELVSLRLAREAAGRSQVAARRGVVPELRVSGGARWDALPGGAATPGMELGGAMSLPILDGTRTEVRRAETGRARADARYLRREAELMAAVEAAWTRASRTNPSSRLLEPEGLWTASLMRYEAGETSLDALLEVAEDVEAASIAIFERERLNRLARIDLSCASGRFEEPALQALYEGLLP